MKKNIVGSCWKVLDAVGNRDVLLDVFLKIAIVGIPISNTSNKNKLIQQNKALIINNL